MSGGVGVLSIEVARLIPGSLAISIDLDPAACAAAATYVNRAAAAAARRGKGLLGSVSVMCADMSSARLLLRPGCIDVVGETLNV